jgi:toxin ParE1/3/4
MRLRLSNYVAVDLEQIADYIAQDSPRNAIRFIRILRRRMQGIAKQPQLYQLRPELGPDARLATVGNYVILFRVLKNAVRVERVLQGSRDLFSISTEFEN